MNESTKFKLNFKTGEIEIEGTEAFVERQILSLEGLIKLIEIKKINSGGEAADASRTGQGDITKGIDSHSQGENSDAPHSFGEWMHGFQADLNDLDKALITASYVQSQSSTNDFKTSEVNAALKDHGIKLSNPSVTLTRLSDKKLMFQTRKVGKLKFLRVSQDGQAILQKLKRAD